MQAFGPGPPLLSLNSAAPQRAQAYPAQDAFQALLQGRMVAQESGKTGASSQSLAQSGSTTKYRLDNRGRLVSPFTGKGKATGLKPALRDLADGRNATGLAGDSQTRLTKSSGSTAGATRSKLAEATVQSGQPKTGQTQEMSPYLAALIDFLNQQPGGSVAVPPDRLPEVQSFLLKAGLPAAQVEQLISSPRLQEQGLTAADVQAAWQRTAQDTSSSAGQPSSRTEAAVLQQTPPFAQITSQEGYRRMWQSLRLPSSSLPQLRLALQRLGVKPEALSALANNSGSTNAGIPLSQVWSLLQQAAAGAGQSTTAATGNASGQSAAAGQGANSSQTAASGAPLQADWQDREQWRQFLVQAGMDPELAQTLLVSSNPASGEEVRQTLLQLAPPEAEPAASVIPRPLFLPSKLRFRQAFWQQDPSTSSPGGDQNRPAQAAALSTRTQDLNSQVQAGADLKNMLPQGPETMSLLAGQEQASGSGLPGAALAATTPLPPELQEALWPQLQQAVLAHLKPGENQVTVKLHPPELGSLQLTLNLKGQRLEVAAVADRPEVAQAAAAAAPQLSQTLAQQGMALTQFQAGFQDTPGGRPTLAWGDKDGGVRSWGKKGADQTGEPVDFQTRMSRRDLWQEAVSASQEGGDLADLGQDPGLGPQAQNLNQPVLANLNFEDLLSQSPQVMSLLSGKGAEVGAGLSGGFASETSPSTLTPMPPELRADLWSQVQNGVLAHVTPGESKVSLTLNPPDLGSLQLTMNLKGQHLEVTAVADRPEVAQVAAAQVQQLAQALTQQGLVLTQFQVQCQDDCGGRSSLAFSDQGGGQRSSGKKDANQTNDPGTPRRRRSSGGLDFFV